MSRMQMSSTLLTEYTQATWTSSPRLRRRYLCLVVTVFCSILLWFNATSEGADKGSKYVVFSREIMDNKLKTQVLLKIIVPAGISKAELEGLLSVLSREQLETQGYKYHRSPTHIAIYAYVDKKYAADGSGWVGRLMRMGEVKSDIIVNEQLLNAQKMPPEVKDGLSEDARRGIYWDMVAAEDRAQREAQQAGVSIRQESELKRSLKEKYQMKVLAKHNLTAAQWANIGVEGQMKHWPTPEP